MNEFNDDKQHMLEFLHNSSVTPEEGKEYLYVEGLFRVNVRVDKIEMRGDFQNIFLTCIEDSDLMKSGRKFDVGHSIKYANQLYKFWPKED